MMQVGREQQDAELLHISECVDRSLFVDEQSKVNELVQLAECILQKAIIMRLGKAHDGVGKLGTGSYAHALRSIMYMLTDLLCNLCIFKAPAAPMPAPSHDHARFGLDHHQTSCGTGQSAANGPTPS